MFARSDLEALAAHGGEEPVLSVYLHMDPRLRGTPDAYRARLRGLLKQVGGRAPDEDVAAVEEYFEKQFDWSGRSVAVFSSQDRGLWQTARFAVPLRSSVHVGQKPFILPLANLMDTYGSYCVALVDQQAMRLFYVHLGELVASDRLEGDEVKRLKGGGGAASRARGDDISGRGREMVRGNLKDFADALVTFCKRNKAEHILLGGADTTVHQFADLLPQPWSERVEGMFSISMRAPENEVLAQSLEVLQERFKAREAELVDAVLTLAAKGANGVVGLDETRKAAWSGRVQTLLLAEGIIAPEVLDPLIATVVDLGGTVEFVDAESPLSESGGVGALLRY